MKNKSGVGRIGCIIWQNDMKYMIRILLIPQGDIESCCISKCIVVILNIILLCELVCNDETKKTLCN